MRDGKHLVMRLRQYCLESRERRVARLFAACRRTLPSLSEDRLLEIERTPTSIGRCLKICYRELVTALGNSYTDISIHGVKYVFCAVVAHALKPWGPGTSLDLNGMLHAQTLNCSNYGVLSLELAKFCDGDGARALEVHLVGREGGAIGNHQMLFVSLGNCPGMILDPTFGFIARGNFNSVAAGQSIQIGTVRDFSVRSQLDATRAVVLRALVRGQFKPSDLLYYFESSGNYVQRYGDPNEWPTPGAIARRKRQAEHLGQQAPRDS